LLRAKLHAPTINKNTISREKLYQKLQRGTQSKLMLVIAPAGYGKTTAVLDWIRNCGLPSAWLSMDARDNNPVLFWNYFCAALDPIVPGISKSAAYVFDSPELLRANIHINILIDRLAELTSDALLVLDDLHTITDPSILGGLSYLISYLPEKMHLMIISRTEPGLEISKQRIKWQIGRLDQKDLRFRNPEISRFFKARGIMLENDSLKEVESYTEGWAAALVAVAMSLEDEKGEHNAIAALSLSQSSRDIEEYLKTEVLSAWLPEKKAFAVKTAILDTLSEDICNAVTGADNAGEILKELHEGNGFLVVVDEQKHYYRYHYLFKNFLTKLLLETDPEGAGVSGLYVKAAHWFREHKLVPEAIEYFLNGGAYPEAYELIEQQIEPLLHKNDFGTLLAWIEHLPKEYMDQSFQIALFYTIYYAETGHYDLSRQWLGRMKAMQDDDQDDSRPGRNKYNFLACSLAEANLLIREGKIDFLPLVVASAETHASQFYKMSEYNDFNTADIYFYRSPISKIAGFFGKNPAQYGKLIESYRKMISVNPGYAPLGVGEYMYETNQLEEALSYLLKALEEAENAKCPGALVPAMVDIARIKRAGGDPAGALEVLEECRKKLEGFGKAHWIYMIQAFRCRIYLERGDTAKVEEWLASCQLNIFTGVNRIREFELLIYARVLMMKERLHDARLLLQRLLSFTEENARLHSRVEVLNLLALLDYQNNHLPSALSNLEKSLEIGMEEGYVRSYLDELTPMARLLRYYTISRRKPADPQTTEQLTDYAKELLRQIHENFPEIMDVYGEAAPVGMKELFTEQEKKVLELLMKAHTNQEISVKLGIGLRTVKTHTANIYGKLGVKNRAQCVKLVRETKLLEKP
jgi:LuxR family transcriptional regulator, maltose regulon positive regulatory protein